MSKPEPSFRTLCFSLISEIDRYLETKIGDPDPHLGRLISSRDNIAETLIAKAKDTQQPVAAPSFDELQELWMSEVTLEQAANYPTRAVWFANTVLQKWGYIND